ncbi:MAG: NAD(P)(+) transhydrogenase (Re/Si-specific) subunit beta [Planctomycetota bacterium]|nr:MAG: NAD(P)(+) transhydrogenase (Re/Si-specific) subunit beta [Planctomycetota bacterium]
MNEAVRDLVYLVAASLFIFGIKGLTHPRTAVRGNLIAALGMLLAVVVTLAKQGLHWELIAVGLVVGSILGAVLAIWIQMTAMPQLVALFNGFGGGASALVAGAYLLQAEESAPDVLVATALSGLIGAVTFSGSMVAFGKLQGLRFVRDVRFAGQQFANGVLLVGSLALAWWLVQRPDLGWIYVLIVLLSLALGVGLVISIGGADMPVVIALLNSYSGLAAAATGFVVHNNILIISGALVGASGVILTRIMCVAMNRSLPNVLFGTMGGDAGAVAGADEVYATVKSTTPEEVAMLLESARYVVIVPGYGMAVAQAQHAVSDLAELLTEQGIRVEFGIHPVAGRMPGHMNVLLAEADIPYEVLKDLDEINATIEQADVAIVLGANDVVNPAARDDPNSPIAGMPIINVDKAKTVVVIKRSLAPGFAGIPNPLFAKENTLMLFADGRKAVMDILTALKEG